MKSSRLLLALLLALSLAACSTNSDDIAQFDFNGVWRFTYTYVSGSALGPGWTNPMDNTITRNGSQMTMVSNNWSYTGSCDPAAGTFTVQYTDEFVIYTHSATEATGTTMRGEFTTIRTTAPFYPGKYSWVATLVHR